MENNASVQPTGNRRRRRLQFSLRSAFVCMALLGVGLSATSSSRQQRRLVEVIERNGGEVEYDYEPASDHPPGPRWIRDILGDGLFFRPRSVVFMGNFQYSIPEDALRAMARLDSLVDVEFHMYTRRRDQLKYLLLLKNLQTLESGAIFFGDTEIEQLKCLVKLRHLSLYGTKITARGVAALRAIGHIESLDIGSGISKIDDDAVRELSSIRTIVRVGFNAQYASDPRDATANVAQGPERARPGRLRRIRQDSCATPGGNTWAGNPLCWRFVAGPRLMASGLRQKGGAEKGSRKGVRAEKGAEKGSEQKRGQN